MKSPGWLAAAIFGLCASPVRAHPMGNFSVNRYARLEPSEQGVSVLYVVDFAEIPTVQSMSRYPSFAADPSLAALNASPDREALCRDLADAWQAGLSLRSATDSLALRRRSSSLVFSPGAGGLPTMKLRLELETSSPRGLSAGTLRYEDDNARERIGWREVVVRPGPGVALSGDTPTLDRSRELTDYPADPAADIPQTVTATLSFSLARSAPGPAVGHPAEILGASHAGSLSGESLGRPAGSAGALADVTPRGPSLGGAGLDPAERSRRSGPGPTRSAKAGLRDPEG